MKYFLTLIFLASCNDTNLMQAVNSATQTSSSSVTLLSSNSNSGGTIFIAASTVDIYPGMLPSQWILQVQSSGCNLYAGVETSTNEVTDTESIDSSFDSSNQCVLKIAKSKFNAHSFLSIDHLPIGSYDVVLNIIDENGKVIEQGVTNTPVINGEVSRIDVQVFPAEPK